MVCTLCANTYTRGQIRALTHIHALHTATVSRKKHGERCGKAQTGPRFFGTFSSPFSLVGHRGRVGLVIKLLLAKTLQFQQAVPVGEAGEVGGTVRVDVARQFALAGADERGENHELSEYDHLHRGRGVHVDHAVSRFRVHVSGCVQRWG